jgi:hypothetical protein
VVLPRSGLAPARDATLAALFTLDDASLRRDVAQAARAEGILAAELRELAARDPDPRVRRAAHSDDTAPFGLELSPEYA